MSEKMLSSKSTPEEFAQNSFAIWLDKNGESVKDILDIFLVKKLDFRFEEFFATRVLTTAYDFIYNEEWHETAANHPEWAIKSSKYGYIYDVADWTAQDVVGLTTYSEDIILKAIATEIDKYIATTIDSEKYASYKAITETAASKAATKPSLDEFAQKNFMTWLFKSGEGSQDVVAEYMNSFPDDHFDDYNFDAIALDADNATVDNFHVFCAEHVLSAAYNIAYEDVLHAIFEKHPDWAPESNTYSYIKEIAHKHALAVIGFTDYPDGANSYANPMVKAIIKVSAGYYVFESAAKCAKQNND
jgi:hypothetical protein